ncbi:MAG: response regulator transcription factor [Chitinophagaceae bacterium]|nr:response regulator transcription factor [Chitinophagaceae bacterium]
MFSIIFKLNNFQVRAANNIRSLFRELNKKIPDLLIIDITSDGKDGREVCKHLKAKSGLKRIPIVLMSTNPNQLSNYKDYWADDILEKPFNIQKMVAKAKSLIQKNYWQRNV